VVGLSAAFGSKNGSLLNAISCAWCFIFAVAPLAHSIRGEDLVNIQLASKFKKYSPENPVEKVAQEFSLNVPGELTVIYSAEPFQSQNGGYGIGTVDGSPFDLGREILPKGFRPMALSLGRITISNRGLWLRRKASG